MQVARSSWALPTFQRLSLPAGAASTSIVLPPQQVCKMFTLVSVDLAQCLPQW